MALFKNLTKDPMNKKRKAFFESRKWHFYLWEFLVILFTIMIVALLNQLPRWIGETHKIQFADGNGGIDYYISNSLNENIYYSFIILAITIAAAVFIGVYNVMNKFIGKYSTALFVLVPSLVWLLTTTKNNHISNIIEINNDIYNFSFWLVIGLTGFYFTVLFIRQIIISFIYGFETRRLIEIVSNGIYRVIIVFINIAALFILSSALVNFGLFSLHLTDIPLEDQLTSIFETGEPIPQYAIPSTNMTTYIAIVTLMFAILVVAVGLATTFTRKYKQVNVDKTLEGVVDINQAEAATHEKKMETAFKQKIADDIFIAEERVKKEQAISKKEELTKKIRKEEERKTNQIVKETTIKEKEIEKEIIKVETEKGKLEKTAEKITQKVEDKKDEFAIKVEKLEATKMGKITEVNEKKEEAVKEIEKNFEGKSTKKMETEKKKIINDIKRKEIIIKKTIDKKKKEIIKRSKTFETKAEKEILEIKSKDIMLEEAGARAVEKVKEIKSNKKLKVKDIKRDIKEKVKNAKKIAKDKKG